MCAAQPAGAVGRLHGGGGAGPGFDTHAMLPPANPTSSHHRPSPVLPLLRVSVLLLVLVVQNTLLAVSGAGSCRRACLRLWDSTVV